MTQNATYASASERWVHHYFACEVCQIHEREPELDRLCATGSELRDAAIAVMYRTATCPLCEQPLLSSPAFWIDRHHNGVHDSCEEQRLANQAMEEALRTEALGLG